VSNEDESLEARMLPLEGWVEAHMRNLSWLGPDAVLCALAEAS
jgi:hypothetical protein